MTKPTRQDIINAHIALGGLKSAALRSATFCGDTEKFLIWYEEILKALPHKPRLTMADIEWNNDEHYFAEAKHPDFGNVIMLGPSPASGDIRITRHKKHGKLWQLVEPNTLILTGKRYTLKEILD